MTDIIVPVLGESVTEATVGGWMVKAGDSVSKDDVLVELETDKVAVEVRAEADGVITAIVAEEGDTVEIGAKLAEMGGAGAAAAEAPAAEAPAPAAQGAAPAAAPSGAVTDATVPQMGESVTEGTIGSWLVGVGDTVEVDQALVEIETDKVAVEVPSPVAGTVTELLVGEGDSVAPGDAVARISEGAGAAAPASAPAGASPDTASASTGGIAMPSAARIIEENNLDAGAIAGTGKDGRITKADAKAAADAPAPVAAKSTAAPAALPVTSAPTPSAAPAAPRETGPREERVRMTRLRQTIAKRLKDAQNSAAILTTYNEADMSAIMKARKAHQEAFVAKHGVKLGFMSFFVKACVNALKEIPAVNAEIDGTDIIYKNYYDMGVAVGTDRGLVVPVVRDADQMSLADIEKEIISLGKKARDGKLTIEDMQGATFTLSNGGVYGSLMSMPILNAPQSGILGMHKIQERPVAENGQVVIKPMMYLALSYDHRIVDGKEAVTFLVRVKENLEDPQRMLFDL
ncbi:MAG: 2-oxoglutarate dehydrogenase complex dihydrolipoyllysine-residue succinyltransferase [Maricaulis sp.]|uniref:2-oxoglutarate dehydrogenase complex dihydrolipoyllysine-residue succinyltransferase n=1 Tax=Maricaulis sp. TaxID=1486257 RepID=UPI001B0BF8BD|nr:2-oxoglutarate dehydrogenase complex dihydrolipoyllysine-residue succinyltransferase [Maricaulis sp.]MBO6730391.1 2-oxoglutarate dehydrogenase complex dihydrolipoyllysine-residue succinyltransferase [Maricaulis sp.]MBO6846104.1 2-oxoglutarate dehydrogenase complex dihydrolipoyllysine-residue succinyltransferase [Maricaulis sp.]MBO6876020.1 2-oxoglutarate dehydrogenase complex dihydrolipoyllysine-residue succinyltransferase [Maricaulis sp.]